MTEQGKKFVLECWKGYMTVQRCSLLPWVHTQGACKLAVSACEFIIIWFAILILSVIQLLDMEGIEHCIEVALYRSSSSSIVKK